MINSTVFEAIFKDQNITLVLTDSDFVVIEINGDPGFFLADENENLVGQSLFDLVPELVECGNVLTEILEGKQPRFELSWVNRQKNLVDTKYFNLIYLPYRNEDGQITGVINLAQDISEQGEVQQKLAQHRNELRLSENQLTNQNIELIDANAELQHLAEIKSMFVSIAAHELRSPLTSIVGYTELLLSGAYGEINKEQYDCLITVQQSAGRLHTIASTLLIATRIEAGRIELILQPTDLALIIRDLVAEFKPQIDAQSQKIIVRVQSGLPNALADKHQVTQIISNLISNASKYTLEGGEIVVSLSTASDTDGFLQVSIADNGVGIPAKDQPKLFERFYRASSVVETGAGGTGLGLYIARSLVELHGGRIWFESEHKKGSTFYITFPIADRTPRRR